MHAIPHRLEANQVRGMPLEKNCTLSGRQFALFERLCTSNVEH